MKDPSPPIQEFSAIQGGDGMKKCPKNVLKLCRIFREEDGMFNFLYGKGMDLFWNNIVDAVRDCYIQYNYLFNMRSYKKTVLRIQ